MGSIWASFWISNDPKIDPKSFKNRLAAKCHPRSLQDHPRPPQDAPRTLPWTPRPPQDAKKSAREPLDGPKSYSEAHGQTAFFGKVKKPTLSFFRWGSLHSFCRKIRKNEFVERFRKKSQPCVSTILTQHNRSQKSKVIRNSRTPEIGGGGRAKRSSIIGNRFKNQENQSEST